RRWSLDGRRIRRAGRKNKKKTREARIQTHVAPPTAHETPLRIRSRRIANPITAPQDASHFLPNTWPAWWRVLARPARAIYTGKKSRRLGNLVSVACLTASDAHLMSRAALWHSVVESAKPL